MYPALEFMFTATGYTTSPHTTEHSESVEEWTDAGEKGQVGPVIEQAHEQTHLGAASFSKLLCS